MHKMMEKDWFRHFVSKMIVTAVLLLTGGFAVARAATIDFSTASNPFATSSPYTENGFTVTPIVGGWAISSDAAMDQTNGINEIDVTGAGNFTFSSVDFMQGVSDADYTIIGYIGGRNGSKVFEMDGLFPTLGHWATITDTAYASQLIDTLKIKADEHTTYVTNIVVNPASGGSTPEPGTVALIGCGLAALGLARFRWFRASW